MYAACLHCHAALGRNEALEAFPVARRIAFDPARSRLWAVCLACGRWNLAPLEERWTAIEEAERGFRDAPLRYATEHVGLARLRDGTELVRIGAAPRAEVAAWRYGDRLPRAHGVARGRLAASALALVGRGTRWLSPARATAASEAAERLALGVSGPGGRAQRVLDVVPVGEVPRPAGAVVATGPTDRAVAVLRRRHLADAVLVRPELGTAWRLEVPHEQGTIVLAGADGLRGAAKLLAAVNRIGVTDQVVHQAARKLEEAVDPAGYFSRVLAIALRSRWGREPGEAHGAGAAAPALAAAAGATTAERLAAQLTGRAFWARGGVGSEARLPLLRVPLADRLALEMAAHEDAERAALDGELAALEAAWREAEVIAAIADAL